MNPTAGRGRARRILPALRSEFAHYGIADIRQTTREETEEALAHRAISEGVSTIVAVGGDGTWSNVANAILHSGADVRLSLIAAGTGNDFARTVGAPAANLARTAQTVADGHAQSVDVGKLGDRYFLNVAGFGFDVAVLEETMRTKWLRGSALYVYSALKQLRGCKGLNLKLSSPALSRDVQTYLILVVANARYFGGAFKVAPMASVTDGKLNVVTVRNAGFVRRLRLLGAVARGTHLSHREVESVESDSFTLDFETPPSYELDGELIRGSTARIDVSCLSRALRIAVDAEVSGTL